MESSTQRETANGNEVVPHPLQDVLQDDADTKTVKKNWVKFDDEASTVDNEVLGNNNSNNNNNSSSSNSGKQETVVVALSISAPRSLAVAAATSPNQLSPQPLMRAKPTTASNTNTSNAVPVDKIMNKHSAAVAPVQRSTVASSIAEAEVAPAVLNTESTHVNLNANAKTQQQQIATPLRQQQQQQQSQQQQQKPKLTTTASTPAGVAHALHARQHNNNNSSSNNNNNNNNNTNINNNMKDAANVTIPVEAAPSMRTIELSTGRIREGFANGDVIVTLLPANTKWPWITPAVFRPELVPEELMAQGLTLTVEDYVHAMETLVHDYRFNVYNICYKRVLVCWIFVAFAVLLTLLFSGLQGVALFSLGVGWLFLNAAIIFICMWVKLRLARGLEKCLARVNKQLMRHKILLVLDDRGRISCHKVNLCFIYFDAAPCVNYLNEFLEHTEQNGGEAIKAGWEAKLDLDLNDIVIQGNHPVRLSRKQAVAQEMFLSYLQRWGKDFLRRRLDWTVQEAGVHEMPRHLQSSICPCQYEEELLRNKIKMHLQRNHCCGINCLACWL